MVEGERTGQEEESREPTIEELAEVCKDILSQEQIEELSSMELREALGLAFTYLIEEGIDDPESFLREKGILE